MKKIFVLFLLIHTFSSYGFSFKIGATQFMSTHPADHDKQGIALGIRYNEDKSHSMLFDIKAAFITTEVVNPGAGNNPTAPDEKEDSSGATPLIAHLLYQIRERPIIGKVSFGTTIYTLDLGGNRANTFSESFTYKQEWSFRPLNAVGLKIGALISLSLSNTIQLPTLFAPEFALSFLVGSFMEIEAKYESLNMLFLGDGPDGFTQNIASVNLIFPNRF